MLEKDDITHVEFPCLGTRFLAVVVGHQVRGYSDAVLQHRISASPAHTLATPCIAHGPANSPMPHVEFDGDNSRLRYARESEKLLAKGYRDYFSKGQAFWMCNVVDHRRPLVVLPRKYLDEVRSAPQNEMSFPRFMENLSNTSPTADERDVKMVYRQRERAAALLGPILRRRLTAKAEGRTEKHDDAIEWLIDDYHRTGRKVTPEGIAQDQLGLTTAAIHNTAATVLSTLYDLIDHPASLVSHRPRAF
ncbi:hypothetical protein PG994_015397 [Apiospora phragmitis]|uniref:Cytochrome P450 n=1 Tax=Apiospora phragmitis TaxID=2905665 RepID=A0ABR1SQM2_9PEZI